MRLTERKLAVGPVVILKRDLLCNQEKKRRKMIGV